MAKRSGKTAPTKASPKKASVQRPKTSEPAGPRRPKQTNYKSFRLHKRVKHFVRLPNVWRLTKTAAHTLWAHKKLFIGITLVYGVLNLIFVQGITSGAGDVNSLKDTLNQAFNGHLAGLASSLGVFTLLVGSAGNASNGTAGAYQLFLALIASLAMIWTLRQVFAETIPRVRDGYYKGIYPLVPFVLVLAVIGLQLLPWLVGASLYSLVINNGIAVYFVEKFLWALLYALLALLSAYMVSSSVFALYIVTLPDMTPMKALRSARELVRHRRWTVLRKVLALPVVLLLVAAVIMVPIIIWLTPLAQWVFFLLTMAALLAVHAYMYTLYRELLNE